ncbi:putative polygalacturonase [Lupinus albus]|uniref:Putative polygalacturonase n=1 Tax=Lupinus albus TaxID=3870 RepID=A0A6A4P3V4_LUPAL|nr:putative polygalacturonase [Lupinus albus]
MMQDKGLEIINVTYKDVSGSSASSVAIDLSCNSSKGCRNIIMDRVNLTSVSSYTNVTASCSNVKGQETSVSPKVSCLMEKPPSTLIGSTYYSLIKKMA